jgi:outer membrane protein assembly factor BamE (lipoprotein component of BamABCDE complex)
MLDVGIAGVLILAGVVLLVGIGATVWALVRRRWIRSIALVVAAPAAAYLVAFVAVHEPAVHIFFPDDTIFAAHFSSAAFAHLPIGSSRPDVVGSLGEPLSTYTTPEGQYWRYSAHGPQHKHFQIYIVIFDRNGERVVDKFHEFYTN